MYWNTDPLGYRDAIRRRIGLQKTGSANEAGRCLIVIAQARTGGRRSLSFSVRRMRRRLPGCG
jgi:D-alanyl-D-alanine carboxypeptidase